MNKFFDKVEATKPEASRQSSAEIFVVCQGYIAPNSIDEKFFDPKFVFKDTEGDAVRNYYDNEINSLSKLMEKRRRRGGYDDDAPIHLFKTISITKFIKTDNPYPIFYDYSQVF